MKMGIGTNIKMDIIQVNEAIQKYIKAVERHCKELDEKSEAKAVANRDYDKAMAIAILELRAKDNPVSIVEKLAKGNCSEQLYKKIIAEDGYKSCSTKIDAAKACLNGYQSIFRHLETIAGK
jgi:hypothetical protein